MRWRVVAKNTSQKVSQLHKQFCRGPDGQERLIQGDRYTGAHVILPGFHRSDCCSWVTAQAGRPAVNRQQIWHIKNLRKSCQRHCTLDGASKATTWIRPQTTDRNKDNRPQTIGYAWTPSSNTSGMYYVGYSITKITQHIAGVQMSPQEALG